MPGTMLAALTNFRTVEDRIVAFGDEARRRSLLESMVWPGGGPACGCKRSIAIAERAVRTQIEPHVYSMRDEASAFIALGKSFAEHETVKHSSHECVQDTVLNRNDR